MEDSPSHSDLRRGEGSGLPMPDQGPWNQPNVSDVNGIAQVQTNGINGDKAKAPLRASVAAFTPAHQVSQRLTRDNGGPTIVSSPSKGAFGIRQQSKNSRGGQLVSPGDIFTIYPPAHHEGRTFSTDDRDISHFLVVKNLPYDCALPGALDLVIDSIGLRSEIISCKLETGFQNSRALYLYVNDLSAAVQATSAILAIMPWTETKMIGAEEYFAHDNAHPKARNISAYEGQVTLILTFSGSADRCTKESMLEQIRRFVGYFGQVRSLSMVRVIGPVKASFRAEYFKLSSARECLDIAVTDITISPEYTVHVEEYMPPGYARTCIPAAVTAPTAATARPARANSQEYQMSPTQRTGWVGDQPLTPGQIMRINGLPSPATMMTFPRPSQDSRVSRPFEHEEQPFHFHQTVDYHRGSDSNYTYGPGELPSRHSSMSLVPRREGRNVSSSSYGLAGSHRHRRLHDFPSQPQAVEVARIQHGHDVRTTVMIRNVPNRLTVEEFTDFLNGANHGQYDFSYLRTDFSNASNVGYAFVNFVRPEYIINFCQARVGKPWPGCNSDKICAISYATIQGQDCLIQKFRNSSVMQEYPGYRPKLWYHEDSLDIPEGMNIGDEAAFPSPDNQSKLNRSLDNAQAVGLYPPRANGAGRESGRRRSQFDRGHPRAVHEEETYAQAVRATGSFHYPQFALAPGSMNLPSRSKPTGARLPTATPGPRRQSDGHRPNGPTTHKIEDWRSGLSNNESSGEGEDEGEPEEGYTNGTHRRS